MTDGAPWLLSGEELALVRYVRPAEVARHVALPGRSGESRVTRLQAVYDALAAKRVGYADAAPGAEPGTQIIRPVEQVLWAPRHGTCLDLAVVLAGACLVAGLHPIVVIVDPPGGNGVGHSLVMVRLDRDLHPRSDGLFDADVWQKPPKDLLDELQATLDGAGDLVAVDPNGLAVSLGTNPTRGVGVGLAAAVNAGAEYLNGYRWRLGVDVGSAWRDTRQPLAPLLNEEPLRPPYRAPETADSPLRLLRAEYAMVPFQSRDELTVLRDWCRTIAAGDRTGLAVITGIGGAGKTRLALELADRLRRDGWYAGTLPKNPSGVEWLSGVVSPVLVVLDYADGRAADAIHLLSSLRVRSGPPSVVVLVARAVEGDWIARVVEALDSDAHPYRRELISLPDIHPDAADVFHRTASRLSAGQINPPVPAPDVRWSTLDYVLLAWIAAQGTSTLPSTHRELYDETLNHEQNYWRTVHRDHLVGAPAPDLRLLRAAAACLSMVAASETDAYTLLVAIPQLAENPTERLAIERTMVTCLRPAPGEGLCIRPDPVGDHLILREFSRNSDLMLRVLAIAGKSGLRQTLETLGRAGQNDFEAATELITVLLAADPDRWRTVLDAAAASSGAAAAALDQMLVQKEASLPLDEISESLPLSSVGLYRFALAVDECRLATALSTGENPSVIARLQKRVAYRARHAGDNPAALRHISEAVRLNRALVKRDSACRRELAESLNALANHLGREGDHIRALETNQEAVGEYRQLVASDTGAHLPGLAMALVNMASEQVLTGDFTTALETMNEAVGHYRHLVESSVGYLPELATALNNLANQQADLGAHSAALDTITEAVKITRLLAEVDPSSYLRSLAIALNSMSFRQADNGGHTAALDTIAEAVTIRRELSLNNPAVFLPELLDSLNNLATHKASTGDHAGALATMIEAMAYARDLAINDSVVNLRGLAMSLANLSTHEAKTGDHSGALSTVSESVSIYRQLAASNPAAYLPILAGVLNNMANQQADTGDHLSALTTVTEAVDACRQLAALNPDVHLPRLGMTLNTMATHLAAIGDHEGALKTAIEAATISRRLAEATPSTHLRSLARALNNLASRQADVGDHTGALNTSLEAVKIDRQLAASDPMASRPDLAESLNNLSNRQAEIGDHSGALKNIVEAVAIRRRLTEIDSASAPDLARSLNNLANQLANIGDHGSALLAINEAIDMYRKLVRASPAAYLPELASSMITLSNQQAAAGDYTRALKSINDAVEIYRQLVQANRGYLPDLAKSLNNLSNQQENVGDHAGALITIDQVVEHLQQLTAANPAAYTRDLSGALINRSNQQANTGDHDGALTTIDQVVRSYRRLVSDDPESFLADLAGALTNLAIAQANTNNHIAASDSLEEATDFYRELATSNPGAYLQRFIQLLKIVTSNKVRSGELAAANSAWCTAIEAMSVRGARALIWAVWATQLFHAGSTGYARDKLLAAVAEVDNTIGDPVDRESALLLTRARWAIRASVQELHPTVLNLPIWAVAPIAESHFGLFNSLIAADEFKQVQLLQRHRALVLTPEFRAALRALAVLRPDVPLAQELLGILNEVSDSDLDIVLARHLDNLNRRAVFAGWVATATWDGSKTYFMQHREALIDAKTRRIIGIGADATERQHLAILDLVASSSDESAYEIVSNVGVAADAAVDAIEAGDLTRLEAILTAADVLDTKPDTWNLAMAVLHASRNDLEQAQLAINRVAARATPIQRRAHSVRLRALLAGNPNLTELAQLIDMIEGMPS